MSLVVGGLKIAAGLVVVPLVIALGLIASQKPQTVLRSERGLDFSGQLSKTSEDLPLSPVPMRDGWGMATRKLDGPAQSPLVILIHGSGWHGGQFSGLARKLSAKATILVPDLRGHGATPERRGDVDYIGQMEDDLADLILASRLPGQKVVLLGHSSGGGLVIRFAGGTHRNLIDGAVLLAPFVHHTAATTRKNSGGWAHPLLRRIIGLSMLNTFRIHLLDHLTAIQFAMPQVVLDGPLGHTATTHYSWRLNVGFAPRSNYKADIAKLPRFLLVAGAEDEAFFAKEYEPLFSGQTSEGRYQIVPGVGHLDIVDAAPTTEAIVSFIDELN